MWMTTLIKRIKLTKFNKKKKTIKKNGSKEYEYYSKIKYAYSYL
jgi:hypothetical protein